MEEIKLHILVRNIERYGDSPVLQERWPKQISVLGTMAQARFVADCLSSYEAGCDYFWYVVGDES